VTRANCAVPQTDRLSRADCLEPSIQPPASTMPDEVLLRRIGTGDQVAMQALYARHHRRVFSLTLRQVGNPAVAEDVTSEVFLDVWRQADRFEGKSAVTTWLSAITRFKACSATRRRREEPWDEETAVAIEDPTDDPEVVLDRKKRHAILRKCMIRLSPEHRRITDLVYCHEKSMGEVAQIVNITENAAKMRMFYARRKLADLLAAEGVGDLAA
jgi:RNA polymerase sigma-70 factor, ECF subfamily